MLLSKNGSVIAYSFLALTLCHYIAFRSSVLQFF